MKDIQNQSWSAWELAWSLGWQIAIPLVIFSLAGRLLDNQLNTSPWLLLTGVVLAATLSSVLVYRKVTAILNELDRISNNQEKDKNNNNSKK